MPARISTGLLLLASALILSPSGRVSQASPIDDDFTPRDHDLTQGAPAAATAGEAGAQYRWYEPQRRATVTCSAGQWPVTTCTSM